jgi:outer membrane protein
MKKTLNTLILAISAALTSAQANADDLLSVYQQALLNDPVVLKSQAQFMIVQEDIVQARAALLPQINLSGGYDTGERESYIQNSKLDTEFSSMTYGANLNMQLYHHDSWLRLDNAEKAAHQSDLSYQIAKQNLIVRVTDAYFNLLGAKDDLVFASAEKRSHCPPTGTNQATVFRRVNGYY